MSVAIIQNKISGLQNPPSKMGGILLIMRNMKQLLLITFAGILFLTTGCKKNSDPSLNVTPVLEISYGGLLYFNSAGLTLTTDTTTVNFLVDITSVYGLSTDLTVTLGVDTAKLNSYNALGGVHYDLLPEAAYSFTTTTVTISAGYSQVSVPVIFYRQNFSHSVNYMLPITIKDAQGNTISTDQSTIYYHFIGNPLAGLYANSGTRTAYIDTISGGVIDSVYTCPSSKTVSALTGITLLCDYADLGPSGWQYKIFYDGGNNVAITPNDVLAASILTGSFKDLGSTYDPATKVLHLRSQYTNTQGDERLVDETLTQQ